MPNLPSELNVRRARDGDLPEMARLHHASFPNFDMTLEQRIDHFRSNPLLSLEDYWICEHNRTSVGMFALYRFNMHRSGKLIPVGGIGSVAVAPEARRRRIGYWMMARAVEIMEQSNTPLSILYPFRHGFYRTLGWGIIGEVRQYKIPPTALPDSPERENVIAVRELDELEEVMACYSRFARDQNGLLERSDRHWREKVFKNALCHAYRAVDSGELEGYILYGYKPLPADQTFLVTDFDIREMAWITKPALRGLLGFLAAQRDQVSAVLHSDQTGLPFVQLLKNPNLQGGRHNWEVGAEAAALGYAMMGRIVQLRSALTAAAPLGNASGSFLLKLNDELSPAGGEPLGVEVEAGRVGFPHVSASTIAVSTDVSVFSSIYWGAISFRQAEALGLIEVEGKGDAGFLQQLFTVPKPMCFDLF